jgi:glycosyltransferase involved in cell wall biosynthesis
VKILILSFYYQPDLSAGAFRVTGLVKALIDRVGKDIQIEVVTTQPNRYQGFKGVPDNNNNSSCIKIHRIKISEPSSGIFDQAKSFIIYAYNANKIIKNQEYDFVISTSSRLMTAALGSWISKSKKIPHYLDIRDIFIETIEDVFPKKITYFLTPIFSAIERFAIQQAIHINLVSPGFESYFKSRYPKKSFSYFENGVDEEFMPNNLQLNKIDFTNKVASPHIRILYAGNIGEGQGLHKIIPMLGKRMGERIRIRVIGGGGRLKELKFALKLWDVNNVEVISPMARIDLIREYEDADVLFIHLNNYKAFEKVLPSKIFEYAALGKPILAGVSGYAAQFLSKEVLNSAIFNPCNLDGAIEAFETLLIKDIKREKFIEKYSRKSIMKKLAEDVVSRCKGMQ